MRSRSPQLALKTHLPDEDVTTAAARIRAGEAWRAVAAEYGVDRCDLSRHFRLLGLEYRRRFYKCRPGNFTAPELSTDAAYIGGLFDGEGHLGWQHGRWYIEIANTNREVIDWLLRFGGKAHTQSRKPPHRDCHYWALHAQLDVTAFLEAVCPYLIIKRDQAAEAIQSIGERPYRRVAYPRGRGQRNQ